MTELPKPAGAFWIKVIPNAGKNEISYKDGKYKARIAAPAEKNKANKELVRFLSKWLGRKVMIKSGLTSREKLVCSFLPTKGQ